MSPSTRFNSVRGGSRSRSIAHKATFRDDTSLVGLRYDKTVAAEPPVHIAPRGASAASRYKTLQRSPSSSTCSSNSYAASVSTVSVAGTAATSIHGGPVVVAPPRLSLPVVAPPTEQHPALRSPAPPSLDGWKRDSGHSTLVGSTGVLNRASPTIPEEGRLNVVTPTDDDDCFVERRVTTSSRSVSRSASTGSLRRSSSKESTAGAASHVERIEEHGPADCPAPAGGLVVADGGKPNTRTAATRTKTTAQRQSLNGPSLASTGPAGATSARTRTSGSNANVPANTSTDGAPTSAARHTGLTGAAGAAATAVTASEPAATTETPVTGASSASPFASAPASASKSTPAANKASSAPALRSLRLRTPSASSPPSSSYTPPVAVSVAAITASDFLPAPLSPPPSPGRSSPRRKLSKRQPPRFSLWGSSRDTLAAAAVGVDDNTCETSSNEDRLRRQRQHQHQPQPGSAAGPPRRWHSGSLLRGVAVTNPVQPVKTGPASAKHQPPISPARSSSRSSLAMPPSSSPDPDPDSVGVAAAAAASATSTTSTASSAGDFSPLGIAIPTERLLDDDFLSSLNFSKRGSLMFAPDAVNGAMDRMSLADDDDRSATPTQLSSVNAHPRPASSATSYAATDDDAARVASPPPDIRVMTPDVEQESQKVRQLYASTSAEANPATAAALRDAVRHSYCDRLEPTPEVLTEDDESVPNGKNLGPASFAPRSVSSLSQHNERNASGKLPTSNPANANANANANAPLPPPKEMDPAGGFEDWDDLDSALVDRYGFIGTPRTQSRVGTPNGEMRSIHYSPRRRNVLTKRDPMGFMSGQSGMRLPSRKVSARSLNTQHSEVSIVSFRSSRSVIRQASNLLPQNRNRRWMDEAGDMLTVSPNLQDSVEEARVEKISEALKRKEIERSEKWRRMARVTRKGEQGHGMEFEFDTKNPKLIERTWKGIPDRWRAAAWWSFLATSAKEHPGSATEQEIIASFHRFQDRASADDIQIDLDVPRTISRHVMFRRRYRGGQRLLFRVLHALSLYFLETGYVQGMASLAATLLCYFDEEKCFVMLVRMWTLRGLERLYQPGFEGLMAALREFETTWLNKDVARKMTDLCIDSTAYGTRWYLTLFNLSIPFPAQLRVWDIFLLLGDAAKGELPLEPTPSAQADTTSKASKSPRLGKEKTKTPSPPSTPSNPSSGLDVLHATSAALIQALREVLLDSDFENAMKALTAWIPIKDEDLLMKVTRAEWKTQLKRRS